MTKVTLIILLWEFGWEYKWFILGGIVLLIIFYTLIRSANKKEIEEKAIKQGSFTTITENDSLFLVNSTDFISCIEDAIESTVLIKTVDGHGSGFIILTDKGWMILTNNHVIDECSYVSLKIKNNEEYGKVVRYDKERDIALISFSNSSKCKSMNIYSKEVSVGLEVYAIGSPLSEEYVNSVSKGIISAVNRKIKDLEYIQSDTTINPGNSGGPLLLESSEVIGVAVSCLVTGDGNTSMGINHFIPIKSALDALKIQFLR